MRAQRVCRLFFKLSWTFTCFLSSCCLGLSLEATVFVACKGEALTIKYKVEKPANSSQSMLTCYDPLNKSIYTSALTDETADIPVKNVSQSGEYYCEYRTAKAYWYLLVRDDGYVEPPVLEYIIIPAFIVVLLIIGVVGSVFVFRGHQNKSKTTTYPETNGKRKQNTEERKGRETGDENTNAPSTSVYASLEIRPGSIYDVLDHSATNTKSDQKKPKAKKKEPQITKTPKNQDEGVFESVYENF
ncbi:NFAT activation molecule 1 [Echeneis naucrates]|uniref:NFAT activation molecule 1 n=1 Tax=Echeneis naucrates TaxID=173247 RepID=UPI0011143ACE|nr:NFAT activation molecule 1 [Echeneis naucrates]